MGIVYIFRGKAATGKSTLCDMLARKLSIPIIRKDDIFDALKISENIGNCNEVCYNILCKIIQTNLDLGTDFILDIALGDRNNAKYFFNRLNFYDNIIVKFFVDCSDENEWKRRHIERLKNPLPHQSFKSIEDAVKYYSKANISPFNEEHIIDSANSIQQCFNDVEDIVKNISKK